MKATRLVAAVEAASHADAAAAKALAAEAEPVLLDRLADLGDQPQLRTLALAAVAAGLAAGRGSDYGPRLARAGLRMLIAHELTTLAKDFVKRRIDRTRPRSLAKRGNDHRPRPGSNRHKEETSFPSGHSAGATSVARALARELPEHRLAATGAAGALAIAQIARRAHYPADVAAGFAIGLAVEAALAALWPARRRPEPRPLAEPLPCLTC